MKARPLHGCFDCGFFSRAERLALPPGRYDAGGGAGAAVASLTGSGSSGRGDRRVAVGMIEGESMGVADPLTGEAKPCFVQVRLPPKQAHVSPACAGAARQGLYGATSLFVSADTRSLLVL